MGKQNLYDQLLNQKKKVDFNTYDFSIKELISLVSDKIVNIAPDYQRQFRWDDARQLSLIESILMKRNRWNQRLLAYPVIFIIH